MFNGPTGAASNLINSTENLHKPYPIRYKAKNNPGGKGFFLIKSIMLKRSSIAEVS